MIKHPYYPVEAIVPNYTANNLPRSSLLATAVASCAVLVGTTVLAAKRLNPKLNLQDLPIITWFVISGASHLLFEAYFVLNHETLASLQSFPAQLWKEYALSDSRYLTSDPFVISIEALTAIVLGPLCFINAYLTATGSPLRRPLRLIACAGHIYSCLLYFMTSALAELTDGISYSRPEPLYFWGYFVGLNMLWIVIPAFLIFGSVRVIDDALRSALSNLQTQ